jgi:uncharacterized protein (TIGR00369 family)
MEKRSGVPEDGDAFRLRAEQAAKGTFMEVLGFRWESVSDKEVTLTLKVARRHLNHMGIVHGGVHASLLDSAMGLAAMVLRPGEELVTTNLNIHYLAPLRMGTIRIAASPVHETRHTVTAQGRVFDEDGGLAAFATASFRVRPGKGR